MVDRDGIPEHEATYLWNLLHEDNLMYGDILGAMYRIVERTVDFDASKIAQAAYDRKYPGPARLDTVYRDIKTGVVAAQEEMYRISGMIEG